MVKKYIKLSILGLLLVMCMSVAMAADVTDEMASDVTVPSNDIIEESATEVVETDNVGQISQTNSYNSISTDTVINDSTWDNQTYDVTSNVKITTNITQSNNIAFNLNGNNITIDGLNIVNDETQPLCINIASGSYDIKILNTNITITNTNYGETKAIKMFNSDNVLVNNTKISMSIFAQGLGWTQDSEGNWVSDLQTSAILVDNSTNVIVSNNKISMTNSTAPSPYETYSTTDAITVRKEASNVIVTDNVIDMDGAYYLYAVDLTEFATDSIVENNIIRMVGMNHFCGIQLASTSNTQVRNNSITGTCTAGSGQTASKEAFAFGIALSSSYLPAASESTNNTIEFNYINITSTVAYAIGLSIADDTKVYNNTAYVYGNDVMALAIYNSSNCQIKDNNFTVSGNTTSLDPDAYDAIPPETTGIKLVDYSSNITIDNNSIVVSDTTNDNSTYCIIIEEYCDTIYVTNNTLYSSDPLIRRGNHSIRDDTEMQYKFNNN